MYLSFFWYKFKDKVKSLKNKHHLEDLEFKKTANADRDHYLTLKGTCKQLRSTMTDLRKLEKRVSIIHVQVHFHKATWEFLRCRQQELNSNPHVAMNIKPDRIEQIIRIAVVSTVDQKPSAQKIAYALEQMPEPTKLEFKENSKANFMAASNFVRSNKTLFAKMYQVCVCADKSTQDSMLCLFFF